MVLSAIKKPMKNRNHSGIAVFGCNQDEAALFLKLSARFGVVPAVINPPVTERSAISAIRGTPCISVGHQTAISKGCLNALAEAGVQYISTRSIGFDHIDVRAARQLGITVENVPYPPDGVADYTIMLLLMALRNAKTLVTGADRSDFRLESARGKELRDMTVGVVGAGRIGRAVTVRLHGFGCRVLVHSKRNGPGSVSLQELLQQSDVITLHVPLSEDTYHMIGPDEIALMKERALLINTARGPLVDTAALVHALEQGKLGGAALDVLEGEEGFFYSDCSKHSMDHPFLPRLQNMSNVIITPHTAYRTDRALYHTVESTFLNCLKFEGRQGI